MKISCNWLKNYISTDLDTEEIADKLTLIGLEVEEMETTGFNPDGFVVGAVDRVEEHPDADRLRICHVDLGSEQVQVVCGAPNVAAGQKVPVATVGSELPPSGEEKKPFRIRKAKLRGVASEGMICSESELGISDDHSGIMVLDESIPAGTPLSEVLDLEEDTIFEIGLTPNRPDAASHLGVARDLAAALGKPLESPLAEPVELNPLDEFSVEIRDTEKCPRYVARIVHGVTIGESPQWLQKRLRSIGLRPVNNVVDATNFILHECGQPLHAFDLQHLADNKIVVKTYDQEMTFRTLDEVERKVPAGSLFICDGEKPVALAGVMGGHNSEVSSGTRSVLIESACFNPTSIRKTSRKLGLQTDASYRYERGVDPNLARKAADRAATLIAELAGGEVVDACTDVYPFPVGPAELTLRTERVNRLLGTDLDPDYMIRTLRALDIWTEPFEDSEGNVLRCQIPTYRPDIIREVDLIEEIGRLFDYNNIPRPDTTPFFRPAPLSSEERSINQIRSLATRLGYKEISTNSLLSDQEEALFSPKEEQIRTLNPVSSEATTLRTTLLAGFARALRHNLNRHASQLRFFEIGHTYRRSDKGTWIEGVEEHSKLLMGLCGYRQKTSWRQQQETWSVFDLKADLESLLLSLGAAQPETRTSENDQLDYMMRGVRVARLLKLPEPIADHFDIMLPAYAAEVDLTLLSKALGSEREARYEPVPKFPSFEYDAAYVMDRDIPAGEVVRLIRESAGSLLENLEVFDIYTGGNLGDGKKSIAFRLTFLDSTKTLTIKDVDPVVQNITQVLEETLGARLRS